MGYVYIYIHDNIYIHIVDNLYIHINIILYSVYIYIIIIIVKIVIVIIGFAGFWSQGDPKLSSKCFNCYQKKAPIQMSQ